MGYLNYNSCYVREVPSSSNCPDGSPQGVANWGIITKGTSGGLTGVTINASGLCTSMSFVSGKTFLTMNPLPETVQFKENGTSNKYGNTTWTATLTGTISGWDDYLRDLFSVLTKTQSHIWVTLLNGNTYLMGVDNLTDPTMSLGAKLTKNEWDSGVDSESEYSGVAFEFTAKNRIRSPRITAPSSTFTV